MIEIRYLISENCKLIFPFFHSSKFRLSFPCLHHQFINLHSDKSILSDSTSEEPIMRPSTKLKLIFYRYCTSSEMNERLSEKLIAIRS